MTILLTKEEAALYREFGPASPTVECLGPENVCQDENYKDPLKWRRSGRTFSDEEARRVLRGLATVSEMYPKRINDKLLAGVFDYAEESGLSALGILGCLDDIVRRQKSAPSLAHFVEAFDELIGPARKLTNALHQAQQRFGKCARDLRKGLNAGVVKIIRQQIPDFPDVDELAKAWESVFGVPFGTFFELSDTERVVPEMIAGLSQAKPWPVIPLYCIWLASQIPTEDRELATVYYDHLAELLGVDDSCNSPAIWKRVIAEYRSHDSSDGSGISWLNEFLEGQLTHPDKDKIAAVWEREPLLNDKSK
jgi:hypothetical protein